MVDYLLCLDKKFGYLTVLSLTTKFNRPYFYCKCDCGKLKYVKTTHLIAGKTKSCGCKKGFLNSQKTKGRISKLLKPNGHSAKHHLFLRYKNDAINRNLSFELEFDYFVFLTSQNCKYCKKPPEQIAKGRNSRSIYIYNGIDRKENNIGYTQKNSVSCCKKCNYGKHEQTEKEFYEWIKKVYENI